LGRREIANIDSRCPVRSSPACKSAVAPQERTIPPSYLSQHRSSLVEQRGARPQRHGRLHGYYTEMVLQCSSGAQTPSSSPRGAASPASSSRWHPPLRSLCAAVEPRAHLFALQPHVRRRPAERTDHRLCVQGSLMLRANTRFHSASICFGLNVLMTSSLWLRQSP
jgi:hypothetical protein